MRSLPKHRTTIGGIGWRILATTEGLTTDEARFGRAALSQLDMHMKAKGASGIAVVAGLKVPYTEDDTAADVLKRVEAFVYMNAA